MTQSKRRVKTQQNRPSVMGNKGKTKKFTAEFGPKPNFMNWKTYHYLAFHEPDKLKGIIAQSAQLKTEKVKQAVNKEWPLGQKPDHIVKSQYHSQARKAPWELQELVLKTYSGPVALAPEQRVFKPSRKLTDDEKQRVASAYGILLSSPEKMDIYLKRLEGIEPSLVGKTRRSTAGTKAQRAMDKSRARTLAGEDFASQKESDYRLRRPKHRGHVS